MKPIAILLAPGTNCHEETAYAVEQAGHRTKIVLTSDLIAGDARLAEYPAVVIPGGFSFGDDFGSGRAFGLILGETLRYYAALGRPILGICNGFQIMMAAGLLDNDGVSAGALVQNTSGLFESRPVRLLAQADTVWTAGYEGQVLKMPVAHGEGRWLMPTVRPELQTTFCYCEFDNEPTEAYPANPNGSSNGVAGLAKGLCMGMMPHPERAIDKALGSIDGKLVFQALVRLTRQS